MPADVFDFLDFLRYSIMGLLAVPLLLPLLEPLINRLERGLAAGLSARCERERQALEATRREAMAAIQKETH